MGVKTEQVEKNLVKLTFEVSAEKFEEGMQYAYRKNVKKISIPGFRKGKVSRAMVEKYYSPSIFYDDAINFVLPEAYDVALKESGAEAVAKPEIDVEEIKKGEPVVFTALVTTKPEVKLGKYKGIEIKKIEHTVKKAEVDKEIEAERNRNARIITVEDRPVEKGEIAVIDFDGFADGVAFAGGSGKDYELEIGSGSFIPGFEEQLIGANLGDDVDVNVTFPEEYHAADLAGKPALFKVKVKEIKKKELPELDDDFASEVSDFDTLKEYKKSVKERLQKAADEKTKNEIEDAVISAAAETCEIDIPQAMIEVQIDRMINGFAQRLSYQGMSLDQYLQYTGSNLEAMRENFKEQAEKQVRTSLMIEAVAKEEGIEANEEEVNAKIDEMSKQYNMEVDKLKELLRDEEMDEIKKEVEFEKTVELLVKNSSVKADKADKADKTDKADK